MTPLGLRRQSGFGLARPDQPRFIDRKVRDKGGKFSKPGAVIREFTPIDPTSRTLQMDPDEYITMGLGIKMHGRKRDI